MGDRFRAFNLLGLNGRDCCTEPLIERISTLVHFLGPMRSTSITPVNSAYGEEYNRDPASGCPINNQFVFLGKVTLSVLDFRSMVSVRRTPWFPDAKDPC